MTALVKTAKILYETEPYEGKNGFIYFNLKKGPKSGKRNEVQILRIVKPCVVSISRIFNMILKF